VFVFWLSSGGRNCERSGGYCVQRMVQYAASGFFPLVVVSDVGGKQVAQCPQMGVVRDESGSQLVDWSTKP
jgi:hypothetical protein